MKKVTREAFSQEESDKIYDNFLALINSRRDTLVKNHPDNPERVAYGTIVNKMKMKKNKSDEKLKEMVVKALKKPVDEGTCGYSKDKIDVLDTSELEPSGQEPIFIKLKEMVKNALKNSLKEKLDPIGKEDGDIDNDGDEDKTDKYLMKKREAIGKSIQKEDKSFDSSELEKSIKSVLKKEGGAVGLKPLIDAAKELGASKKDLMSVLKKMSSVKTHKDGDIIDTDGLKEEKLNEDEDLPIRDNVTDFSAQLLNQIKKYENSVGPNEKPINYTKTIDAIENLMKAVDADEKAVDADEKEDMSYGDAFKANLKARREKEEAEKRKLGFLEEKKIKPLVSNTFIDSLDENIDSKILAYLKSEKDPTDESKPFDIDKLDSVKKIDGGDYKVYYLTNSGKKESILVYQHDIVDEIQKEDLDIGHTDDEPGMLKSDLYRIGKYAMELYKMVDKFDKLDSEVDFPHWWQSKITKSKGMLVSAKHYLDFEMKEDQIDAMVDVASEEGMIDEKFASKAQQKYLYATDKKAAEKLGSKMTKKDYKNLPDKA